MGVGASAGGLEAIQGLFKYIPEGLNAAFVVVQHLSPHYKSLMPELVGRHTALEVVAVNSETKLLSGRVYFAPAHHSIVLHKGHLQLVPKEKHSLNLPIDLFFNSLGSELADAAVGVVLSGTGSDGARGLRTIKEVGGLVLVQSPQEAKFDGMPKAALNTGLVDAALPVEELAKYLSSYLEKVALSQEQAKLQPDLHLDVLNRVLQLVHHETGLNFTSYKHATLLRRIEKFASFKELPNTTSLPEYLEKNPQACADLADEFLINVTTFFRDPKAFEALRTEVIPEVLRGCQQRGLMEVRAWVAGCATGEEAYTLGMLLHEAIEESEFPLKFKVFATDLDAPSLRTAGIGQYRKERMVDVPQEYLNRYFTEENDVYTVRDVIRERIVFARHNLLEDPPFIRLDLVLCRNLLIYLQPKLQKKVLLNFLFALRNQGFLMLGISESLGEVQHEFIEYDKTGKIYRARASRTQIATTTGWHSNIQPIVRGYANKNTDVRPSKPGSYRTENQKPPKHQFAHQALENLGLPVLLLDDRFALKYFSKPAAKFLHLGEREGVVSNSVLDMLPQALSTALRQGIRELSELNTAMWVKNVPLDNTPKKHVHLKVNTYSGEGQEKLFFVLLQYAASEENDDLPIQEEEKQQHFDLRAQGAEVQQLQQQLDDMQVELQAVIEELEANNEELQAANEEMMSSNEELQSTNEELQSVNEELYTVNAELQVKNQELSQVNADIDNLLESTEIGTIFIDKKGCLRKFTPKVQEQFNIQKEDVGRPIAHFTHNFNYPGLYEDIQRVMQTGQVSEREVALQEKEAFFLIKITPFFAENRTVQQGVVLSIVDVSSLRKIEAELALVQGIFDAFMKHSPFLAWVKDKEKKYQFVNEQFLQTFGFQNKDQVLGKHDRELWGFTQAEPLMIHDRTVRDQGTPIETIETLQIEDKEINLYSYRFSLNLPSGKAFLGGLAVDLSQQIQKDRNLAQLNRQLQQNNLLLNRRQRELEVAVKEIKIRNEELDQIIYMLSHDLRAPLASLQGLLEIIKGEKLEAHVREYVKHGLSSVHHLEDFTKNLIFLGQANRIRAQVKKINFDELIRQILQGLQYMSNYDNLHVNIESQDFSEDFFAEELKVQVILNNLLSNAVKYADTSKAHSYLNIKVYEAQEARQKNAKVVIEDNGKGIPEKDRERIFKLFEQSDGASYSSGLGIGLYLVQSIVTKLSGKIAVESEPQKGTRFTITLPFRKNLSD